MFLCFGMKCIHIFCALVSVFTAVHSSSPTCACHATLLHQVSVHNLQHACEPNQRRWWQAIKRRLDLPLVWHDDFAGFTGRLCPLACYISGCWSFGVFVAWISAWGRCLDAFQLIWMLLAGGREPEVLALPDLLGLAVARVQQEMLGNREFWVHCWAFAGSAGGAAQKGGNQCGS
jgi:hypothetical protein